jgi:hypothetical protein
MATKKEPVMMWEPSAGLVPIPDPSVLTTEAVQREIGHLRELIEADKKYINERFASLHVAREEKFHTFAVERTEIDLRNQQRFEAQAKAIELAFEAQKAHIEALEKQMLDRFNSVDERFAAHHTESELRYQQRFDAQKQAIDAALESAQKAVAAALDAAQRAVSLQLDNTKETFKSFDERLDRQHKEADVRYQQRFDAQTKALDAAFLSSQTAVTAAMAASEKAVAKAETSAEKRFDSTMELQKSLNETINQQIPRREAEARIESISDKFDTRIADMMLKIDDLKSYSSMATGKSMGMGAIWAFVIGGVGVVSAIISIVMTMR